MDCDIIDTKGTAISILHSGNAWLHHVRYENIRIEPANAEGFHLEPCLKIEKPGKLVHLTLVFASHEIRGDHLQVVLKAKDYPLRVILHYQVYPEFDLIDRWVEVKNEGPEEIVVENIQSAVWYVPHTHKYRLTHIAGNWCAEWQVRKELREQGEKILQSRGGISGHFHVPLFALIAGSNSHLSRQPH